MRGVQGIGGVGLYTVVAGDLHTIYETEGWGNNVVSLNEDNYICIYNSSNIDAAILFNGISC